MQDQNNQPKQAEEMQKPENELSSLTLKQLREKAVEVGVPQSAAEAVKSKAPLIELITSFQKQNKPQSKTLVFNEDPKVTRNINKKWLSKAMRMREILEKQPKVRIFLPLEGKEEPGVVRKVKIRGREEWVHVKGAIETVTLNGYKTIIPKGVYFDVPQQVADVLGESYKQTQDAGKDFRLERDKVDQGVHIREALG